jgi:hypothetical protein
MTNPLVFIFTARIQEGKVDAYRQYAKEHAAFAEAAHPDILAFHLYLSEDERQVSAVQVHPDADSMDLWMKDVVSKHGVTAYDFLEQGSERSIVYGTMNDQTLAGIREYGLGAEVNPGHLAGFTRLATS